MKNVLVIVDLQNDFCPGGSLPVAEGDQLAKIINRLMQSGEYDLVIATKDWHPANHRSFVENWPGKEVFSVVDLNGLEQRLWPGHCVQNTFGAELVANLDTSLIQEIVLKGTDPEVDSYSAFFDNARRNETRLNALLKEYCQEWGIDKNELQLDFTGLAMDVCVRDSALDAVSLGYNTALIVDASRAVNLSPGDDVKTLRALQAAGVELISSNDRLSSRNIEPKVETRERPNFLQP